MTSVSPVTGSVTGGGHLIFFPGLAPGLGTRRLAISAVQTADGTTTGEWQIVVGATILHGDIDCLTILPDGKSARLSGIVEQAKFTSFLPGTAFALELVDSGEGSMGGGDADTGPLAFRNAPPEVGRTFCETGEAPAELELMAIEKGNFQVRSD
jgi:hypothetical protein